MKRELIRDSQSLIGATSRYENVIPTYDDGFGKLFISRDSGGINGIVRARTWEDAYGICEDEFFPDPSDTWDQLQAEFSTQYLSGRELWLHEHKETFGSAVWDAWQLLSEADKQQAYRQGRDVPFIGDITEHPCFQEQYGFRNNGPKTVGGSILYQKDLNGDYLDVLTPELLAELEITLQLDSSGILQSMIDHLNLERPSTDELDDMLWHGRENALEILKRMVGA